MSSTISSVKVIINNSTYTLDYNSQTGKYEKSISAPSVTSYNVNSSHYYPVKIEASDSAGNKTTKDVTDTSLGNSLKLYVKETGKPTISNVKPSASSYVTSSIYPISFSVSDQSNGSGVNPDTIKLTIDSNVYTRTSAGMSMTSVSSTRGYNVTYQPSAGLSDGAHSIKINASDYDGNAAEQVSITYIVDTVSPQLSVTNPSTDGSYVNTVSYKVTGVTNDITSGIDYVEVKLNGVSKGNASVNSGGGFEKTVTLTEGLNTINVKAYDKAGKYSEITRTINLDTKPPVISSISISPNPVTVGSLYKITVTVTDN